MMRKLIFLICGAASFTLVRAQSATASVARAATDKQQILIGEPLQLRLEARFVKGKEAWPQIDSIPHFEVLQRSAVDTQSNYLGITLSQVLTLTSWDSGRQQIPSFVFGRFKTLPLRVDVNFSPSPFDTKQPYHDVKDIIDVQRPAPARWYWYLIFGIVLLVLFLLFFPKEKKKERPAFVTDEGAYKAALRRLDELKNRSGDPKAWHTELIDTFRAYLFKRKNIQSFSKTTDDLALQTDQLQLPRDQHSALLQTLRLSDLVKFARYQPTAQEDAAALETIRQTITYIEQTPHAV